MRRTLKAMAKERFGDCSIDGIKWKVRRDYLNVFPGEIYPHIARDLADPETDIIKKGPARTVFRIRCTVEGTSP
jgi:hypothetical protein